MTITVVAYAGLLPPAVGKKASLSEQRELIFTGRALTVGDVLDRLNIHRADIGVMLVGGVAVKEDEKITDGTRLDLYPFFGGG